MERQTSMWERTMKNTFHSFALHRKTEPVPSQNNGIGKGRVIEIICLVLP